VGDIGTHPVRHYCGEVSGGLEAQAATVLRMWKNSECKGRVRENKEADGKAKPRTNARHAVLKGGQA
jgi:hypothetical protein